MHVDGKISLEHTIFDDAFTFLRRQRDERDAEADDPVAEHGALPRRPRLDRLGRVPGPGRVLERPHRRLRARRCAGSASSAARYLQLDDTSLAYLNDPAAARVHRRPAAATRSTSTWSTSGTSTRRSSSRPAGMTITTHTCRGNFRSSWVAEGGYDFVAEALFNELEVDGFFLEFDDERSGAFEPLRFVPKGSSSCSASSRPSAASSSRRTS